MNMAFPVLWLLRLFYIIPIVLDQLVGPTIAQNDGPCTTAAEFCWKCSDIGSYTNGSIYQRNLDSILSNFSSTQSASGFYNSSFGQGIDTVNAIALCRGDLGLEDCRSCVSDSTEIILRNCSLNKEAILWSEPCMLRYSPNSIFGIKEEDPVKYVPSPNPASNAETFKVLLSALLKSLSDRAVSGNSGKSFAAGHATLPGGKPIYSLAQCTPDIDKGNCSECLENCISAIPSCCDEMEGARVLRPSCYIRYESSLFYNYTADTTVQVNVSAPVAPSSPSPSSPLPKQGKSNTKKTIIIIVVVIAFGTMLLLGGICLFLRVRQPTVKLEEVNQSEEVSFMAIDSLQYDFENIKSATDGFSDENKLGQGGFGAVYKGRLVNGQYVAVKRLFKSSEQGEREFKNEVTLLAQLQHRNLVRLLGFCLKGDERLLVYEYIPNTSLDHFIFDPIKYGHLDWETRYKIIGGIARGLLYLHEDSRLRIIHRDLKLSNILLDEHMNPKIADFGTARLCVMDQSQGDTNTVVGTYGYMAPEYARHGRFSVKSDVFSFGVLVLEIIIGKRSFNFGNDDITDDDFLSFAWRNWRDDTVPDIIDRNLTTGSRHEILRCIHIALLCVQANVNDRPTVASIVTMLNNKSITISVPSRPPYYCHYNTDSTTSGFDKPGSSEYLSRGMVSDITVPHPR